MEETPWPGGPATLLNENAAVFQSVPRGRQRAAQRRGLGSARDKLHGRVVMRRSVVEMARTVGRNSVADGRATGPDPRRQQACPRPPGTARGSRTRTTIFIAATGPDPRRKQACARSSRAPQLIKTVAVR